MPPIIHQYLPIVHLNEADFRRLERRSETVRALLFQAGLSEGEINAALQANIRNIFERKSVLCPYEALRTETLVRCLLREAGVSAVGGHFITLGPAQFRRPVGRLGEVQPSDVLRYWRRGLTELRKSGADPIGFCVFEVNLVRPIDEPAFYEPHLHVCLWGVTLEQAKAAFVVRKLRARFRKRPTRFQPLKDIDGATGYSTKTHPRVHVQTPSRSNWWKNKLTDADASEWYRYMAQYRASDLLKFVGINGRNLGRDDRVELSFTSPQRGRQGPSRRREAR